MRGFTVTTKDDRALVQDEKWQPLSFVYLVKSSVTHQRWTSDCTLLADVYRSISHRDAYLWSTKAWVGILHT